MPDITPIGNANTMLPIIKQNVPTIAGKIPPSVMPSSGIAVRKVQFMTEIPLITIKPRIKNKIPTTVKLTILKKLKVMFCTMIFLFCMRGFIYICFFDLVSPTRALKPKVITNNIIPRAKSALKWTPP